jgi:ComF family protein
MDFLVNGRLGRLWRWWRPGRCRLCAEPTDPVEALCAPCATSLPHLGHACPRCAAPLPAATPAGTECGHCQHRPPPFDRTRALFRYAAPIDRLIARFKYGGELATARFFGETLGHSLAAASEPLPDLVVPVPLHAARLRERGYNQSLEIARHLTRRLRLPLDRFGTQRVRATRPQAGLPRDERRANLRNAFEARRRYDGLRIAIVDDVMTSGHTASALARCLKRAGAVKVVVWVVARA